MGGMHQQVTRQVRVRMGIISKGQMGQQRGMPEQVVRQVFQGASFHPQCLQAGSMGQ